MSRRPNVEPDTSLGWQCGMFAGDVYEQAVLYSSNRAYLCSKLSVVLLAIVDIAIVLSVTS